MSVKVNIIGAGRVGQTFMALSQSAGLVLGDVTSRRLERAEQAVATLGQGRAVPLDAMQPADLWLIAVPDDQIAQAAQALAKAAPPAAHAMHFSGFHPASLLDPLKTRGWATSSLHPVMSFADPTHAAASFAGTYCAIEGYALDRVASFVERLGGVPFPIRSEAKALYHGAAVISNNFTTVLQALAQEAWHAAGVPSDVARHLQKGLMQNALDNVTALGPQEALTGPAARGDRAVVTAQAQAFQKWRPKTGRLYDDLSAMAARLKSDGHT